MCRDSVQDTPLHNAAQYGHIEVVKFLTIDMHCDPTSKNARKQTPLHLAAGKGYLNIIKFFISNQNCDPNTPDGSGKTPLHFTIKLNSSSLCC